VTAKDGMTLTVLKNAAGTTDGHGKVTGVIESFIDVTQLIDARLAAEQASRAKTEFLTNMSHELRTPLNAIIGFAELLLDGSTGRLSGEQSCYVTDVLASGRHLLALINGVLDLAKVEAGKMELEIAGVHIARVIADSLMMIRERAIRRGLTLELSLEPELESLEIQADEIKLKQILYNLLSNAAKFTPDGGSVSVAALKKGTDIVVSITDTGIGLRPEDYDRIFVMFEQVDSSYTRRQQGTGLGLALARRLAHLHGGQIWVESKGEGQGSTFHFAVPICGAAR